jgi:hypothetical protein
MTNIIRPSGIYDEPGTFSFFLCTLAVFRVVAGKNDVLTFFMLLVGNITFSLIHTVFFIMFNLYMLGKYYKKKTFIIYIAVMILGSFILFYRYINIFDAMLFNRFEVDHMTRSSRFIQIERILLILRNAPSLIELILFGNPELWEKERYLYSNPLGPLVYHGLLISCIYYVSMLILLFSGAVSKKYRYVLWAIALVYVQRPFYSSFGASTSFHLVVFIAASIARMEIKKYFINKPELALCKTP